MNEHDYDKLCAEIAAAGRPELAAELWSRLEDPDCTDFIGAQVDIQMAHWAAQGGWEYVQLDRS